MYLDKIVAAQKRGEVKGITSVCSAHPDVIRQTLRFFKTLKVSPLIEATCNQVNQFGGYTGMRPKEFVAYVRSLAQEVNLPFEEIILGGDHLGPNVWQNEPAASGLKKSEALIREYVLAGFTKIHLDCSMRLADDPQGTLDVEVCARRTAQLAKVAEMATGAERHSALRFVIGTEVPVPGGAAEREETVRVTKIEDVQQTIEVTHEAFVSAGIESAWERVVGVVVQPGVEFGDDFVIPYQPEPAQKLAKFIENQPMIYEAHSTDYQTRAALQNLVRDHFAILKVGPALTFAFREAVFTLAMMERELFKESQCSKLIQVLEDVMLKYPEHWIKYYHGDEQALIFKRRYSLSDRIRYYWVQPEVQSALKRLMSNLGSARLPDSLLREHHCETGLKASQVIENKIGFVLHDYWLACGNTRD